MPLNPRRAFCGLLITAGAIGAGSAIAAEPGNGKIDSANPRIDWKGEVTASWVPSRAVILADIAGESGSVPCEAPTCDSFALTVGEKKDLTIGVTAPEPDDQVIFRVQQPDGAYVTTVANADAKGNVIVKFKGAAPGDYVLDYWNYYTTGTQPYAGYAQLAVPAAAAPAPAADTPPNQQQQTPQQGQPGAPQQTGPQPQPTQPNEAIALNVKVGKASAKKLKKARKLVATVTVSRPATVSGTLKKGKKTVAKGKVLVKSSGKLKLKIAKKAAKKLKKGTYKLVVSATDGRMSTSKTVKVKIRK